MDGPRVLGASEFQTTPDDYCLERKSSMSGVKGMHNKASRSPFYAESIRARIRAGGIAKRLENHILGKIEMSQTQVTAAVALLKLVIPQQTSVEHKGEVNHYVAQLPEVEKTQEEWKQHYAPTIN